MATPRPLPFKNSSAFPLIYSFPQKSHCLLEGGQLVVDLPLFALLLQQLDLKSLGRSAISMVQDQLSLGEDVSLGGLFSLLVGDGDRTDSTLLLGLEEGQDL